MVKQIASLAECQAHGLRSQCVPLSWCPHKEDYPDDMSWYLEQLGAICRTRCLLDRLHPTYKRGARKNLTAVRAQIAEADEARGEVSEID